MSDDRGSQEDDGGMANLVAFLGHSSSQLTVIPTSTYTIQRFVHVAGGVRWMRPIIGKYLRSLDSLLWVAMCFPGRWRNAWRDQARSHRLPRHKHVTVTVWSRVLNQPSTSLPLNHQSSVDCGAQME